jgi:hypothetical protein
VSECDREASIMRRPWPNRGCCVNGNKIFENQTLNADGVVAIQHSVSNVEPFNSVRSLTVAMRLASFRLRTWDQGVRIVEEVASLLGLDRRSLTRVK